MDYINPVVQSVLRAFRQNHVFSKHVFTWPGRVRDEARRRAAAVAGAANPRLVLTQMCIHTPICISIYLSLSLSIYICIHMCIYIYIHKHACVYIYIYTYIHTYIHMYLYQYLFVKQCWYLFSIVGTYFAEQYICNQFIFLSLNNTYVIHISIVGISFAKQHMCMYVCVYTYIHTYIYNYINLSLYIQMCIYIYIFYVVHLFQRPACDLSCRKLSKPIALYVHI